MSVKQHQKLFLSAEKGAAAGSGSSLLFLFSNACGSAAIEFEK